MFRRTFESCAAAAAWTCLIACASATAPDLPRPTPAKVVCDADRAASLETSGDLDGALDAIAGCAPDPPVLLRRMQALVELGEIARAKEIARSFGPTTPPAIRGKAEEVLALVEPSPSPADTLRDARSTALEAAKLATNDPPASARAYGRARHLFERATGASSARVAIEAPTPVGWAGAHPTWSVTLRSAAPEASTRRRLLVTDLGETGAIVPTAALDLGPDDVTPIPSRAAGTRVVLATKASNALWSAPWLAPFTLPAGTTMFGPAGSRVLIARGGDLEAFDTNTGTRLFAWPHVKATGAGAFVAPDLYAEVADPSGRALVVNVANGTVLVDEPDAIASAVSPSGKLVAVLDRVQKPNEIGRLTLALTDLGAPSKPTSVVDVGKNSAMEGSLSVEFDGDRGMAVLLTEISGMGGERPGAIFSYVALGAKRASAAPSDYAAPDRSAKFARIAKLAVPSPQSPRSVTEFYDHSETFFEDRASARAAVVTGIKIPLGLQAHIEQPGLVFVDQAAKKLVSDVRLPVADFTLVGASLAPGGRSGIVCSREGPSFLVDSDTGDVISGAFDCASASEVLWSTDGERLIAPSGVVTLHAKGSHALVETALPTQDAACLIGTMLAPAAVCR